ncbi:MAG: Fic family protein, partial [Verrucomicrobia bacterium]|nr:Fic family protein [Verrucomicrobiota bacterium]
MRTYEQTHPWITFQADLKKASPKLWMNLGEIRSKCDHIAGVPLRPFVAQRLHQLFLARGVLGTT